MAHEPPLGWEQLVTEGHVLSARLRRRQPFLIGLALALMLIGWILMGLVETPKAENDRARVLGEEVQQLRWRAVDAFAGLPPPRVARSQLATLPPSGELADLQARILARLNSDGEVKAGLGLREATPREFWRVAWKSGETITTADGPVRIVGRLVNAGSPDFPRAARWLGVFRESDGQWTSVAVQGPDFVGIAATPSVAVDSIPVTLKPLLQTQE